METNEIVVALNADIRDVFSDNTLVVTEGLNAADVATWDFALQHQHDRCVEKHSASSSASRRPQSKNVANCSKLIKRRRRR